MKWFILAMKNSFNFTERARRKEYWMFILITSIISIALSIFETLVGLEFTEDVGILSTLFSIILIIPSISVTVRRLHDIGKSGWWVLINLIPIIGQIVLLVFTIKDSTPGTNVYGPNPKEVV